MDAWTVHKLSQRILVQLHYKVLQENLIQMKRFILADPLAVSYDIVEFIFFFAGTFSILALSNVGVNDTNHRCHV